MPKLNKPFINETLESLNYLLNYAPDTLKWGIFTLILLSILNNC